MLRTRFPAALGVGLVLTAAYFLAGTHCLSLAQVHPSISSVWPPTGIAVAAMLVLGSRFAPAIFVGALLVNLAATGHLPSSFGIAIGNTLECLVAAWLVNRFANGCNAFDRPRTFFTFVLAWNGSMHSFFTSLASCSASRNLPASRCSSVRQ